jgi:hypothetical protein
MSTSDYDRVFAQVLQLTREEQLRLLAELAAILGYQITVQRLHSILEFEGIGKELWEGVDVQKYIDEERNSWER